MKFSIRSFVKPIFLLLVATLSLTSCKSDKTTEKQNSATTEANSSGDANAGSTEEMDDPNHVKSSRAAIMVGFWHYAKMVAKPDVVELYRGRWIDLKRNDTFVSGVYDQETNSGKWSLNDESILALKYDKKEEGIANYWMVQGSGAYVVWKGNALSNQSGDQIKMVLKMDPEFPKRD